MPFEIGRGVAEVQILKHSETGPSLETFLVFWWNYAYIAIDVS